MWEEFHVCPFIHFGHETSSKIGDTETGRTMEGI